MDAESRRRKEQGPALLDEAIEAIDPADMSNLPQVKKVFGSVPVLLAQIKVCFLFCCNYLPRVHA